MYFTNKLTILAVVNFRLKTYSLLFADMMWLGTTFSESEHTIKLKTKYVPDNHQIDITFFIICCRNKPKKKRVFSMYSIFIKPFKLQNYKKQNV